MIEIINLKKNYDKKVAVNNLNFQIQKGMKQQTTNPISQIVPEYTEDIPVEYPTQSFVVTTEENTNIQSEVNNIENLASNSNNFQSKIDNVNNFN